MNRRLNGFIKKPHIFIDNTGKWVYNFSNRCRYGDGKEAKLFCHNHNAKEYRNG